MKLTALMKAIIEELQDSEMAPHKLVDFTEVHGGSINSCYHLRTNQSSYFVKINNANQFPQMFEKEAKGLELLRSIKAFKVPEVLLTSSFDDYSFLVQEYISVGTENPSFWRDFALSLAKLHRNSKSTFGLDHDNYIGSLPQKNRQILNWTDFFIENRLGVQEKMARDSKNINQSLSRLFDKLYMKLSNLIPKEKPSLLHGDLWAGNFMVDADRRPVIFDPAVYYGHREMDIAMTQLFGGFSAEMYSAYQSEFPMEQGWQERMDLCNLYPLMVHVNLFGGDYARQVEKILKHFTQ